MLDVGVLTAPDGHAPINVDIGNGPNIVGVHLLSEGDVLSDLCDTGNLLGVLLHSTENLAQGCSTQGSTEPLLDLHTDCGPLLQVHDDSTSLLGVNGHQIV